MTHIVFDHDGTIVDTFSGRPKLYDGILDLLTELKNRDIKMYVWTARGRASTIEILKSLEIIGFFEDISTATDCEPKPSKEGLSLILDGVPKDQILMIGDSQGDIYGARLFGVDAIGAAWAFCNAAHEAKLTGLGALKVCKTVKDCRESIEAWIKGK